MANYTLYGLWDQQDLDPNTPASDIDRDLLINAVEETVATHNTEINTMLGLFSQDTTEYQQNYRVGGANFLQPLDEDGRPLPVKGRADVTVAYALKMGGTAAGSNFVTRAKMTVADFDEQVGLQLQGDVAWIRRHLLAALMTNTAAGWTFADPIYGNLTVWGLANDDAAALYTRNNSEAATIDNHYYAQAAAIGSGNNPMLTVQNELTEHPQNSGPYVMFVNSADQATITGLAAFVELPSAQIANPAPQTTEDVLTATLGVTLPRTAIVLGVYGNLWIVNWDAVPAGYQITLATGGPKPLKRRQDPEAALRGFVNVGERMERFPYFRQEWIRRTGFGGWNRTGAVVSYVGTSGTYAIPSGFNYALLP
jgi:hypothetical protein